MSKPIKDVTEKDDFVRVDPSQAEGTSLRGQLTVAPADLVARFGKPDAGDGYKTSGEYTFRRDGFDREIFTIYDWKITTLYDGENTLRPDDLWDLESPVDFNIGGNAPEGEFVTWVLEKEVAQ